MGFNVTPKSVSQTQPTPTTTKTSATPTTAKKETSAASNTSANQSKPSANNVSSTSVTTPSKSGSSSNSPSSVTTGVAAKNGINSSTYIRNAIEKKSIPPAGLDFNTKNADVKNLQTKYVDLGLMKNSDLPSDPISNFGYKTKAATTNFQSSLGLNKTGAFDKPTQTAITNIFTGNVKRGSSADPTIVTALQKKLVSQNNLKTSQVGNDWGTFGPKTEQALKDFQKSANIQQTGVLGPQTYKALFGTESPSSTTSKFSTTAGSKLPTTVADANKFFRTQFQSPIWNKDASGPDTGSNCGPASVAMALSAVGAQAATHNDKLINSIGISLRGKETSGKTGATGFVRVISQYGGTAERLIKEEDVKAQIRATRNTISEKSTKDSIRENAWKIFDQQLDAGKAVILQGNMTSNYQKAGFGDISGSHDKNDTYGNVKGSDKHILTVVGKTQNGNYIVADPMSRIGAVEMNKKTLSMFLSSDNNQNLKAPINIVAVGKAN